MADKFDPADYKRFKAGEVVNDNTGFDPNEFSQFKDLTTHASLLDKAQDVVEQATKAATSQVDPTQNNQPIQTTSGNPAVAAFQAAMQSLQSPARLGQTTSAAANQMGQNVAGGLGYLSAKAGIPGAVANPVAATAGLATQVATDPMSYVGANPEVGKAATTALDSAAQTGVNKVLAPLGEILSATKQKAIKTLFNDPIGTITAMSSKDAGSILGDVYKGLNNGAGLTDDEMRLISKAADRSTGGSQAVLDQVIAKVKASQLPMVDPKTITQPSAIFIGNQEWPGEASQGMYNVVGDPDELQKMGLTPNTTMGYDAVQKTGLDIVGKDATRPTASTIPSELQPTMGELIAGRRAASKLSTVRRGMEGYQSVQDLNTLTDQMKQIDPQGTANVLAALADVAKGKTKEAFMSLFPLNKNTSANALRGTIALGSSIASGNPLPAVAASPLATGAMTLGASGAYNGLRAGLQNPLVRATGTTLIPQYLQANAAQQGQTQQ